MKWLRNELTVLRRADSYKAAKKLEKELDRQSELSNKEPEATSKPEQETTSELEQILNESETTNEPERVPKQQGKLSKRKPAKRKRKHYKASFNRKRSNASPDKLKMKVGVPPPRLTAPLPALPKPTAHKQLVTQQPDFEEDKGSVSTLSSLRSC